MSSDQVQGIFAELRNRVLILGDGNLSFSLALGLLFPEKKIVATVLESKNAFFDAYASGRSNLDQLNVSCPNVRVLFDIDATNLNVRRLRDESSYFTDIIMNFPHHGGKKNYKKGKHLLRDVFSNASRSLMSEETTRFHVTLAKGQSGINAAYIRKGIYFLDDEVPVHNKDSWQVMDVAADHSLRIEHAEVFRREQFPQYSCTGFRNQDQTFNNSDGAETFSLVKAYTIPRDAQLLISFKSMEACGLRFRGYQCRTMPKFLRKYHVYRPVFRRDISIKFAARLRSYIYKMEELLYGLIQDIAGAFVVDIKESALLRSEEPGGPASRVYQVFLQGWQVPINKQMCKDFMVDLVFRLQMAFDSSFIDQSGGGYGCGMTVESQY